MLLIGSRTPAVVTVSELFPWSFNFIALCAFINWWVLSLFEITGMCSVLLCLHVEQPASGSEEGGSLFDVKF